MNFESIWKPMAAISLAVIMFSVFISPHSTAMATTYPERIIDIKIVFDESYRTLFENENGNPPLSRLRQIGELAEHSFSSRWNIKFNIVVCAYEEEFNDPYTLQCTSGGLWAWSNPIGTPGSELPYEERVWYYEDGVCTCFSSDDPCDNLHHTNISTLLNSLDDAHSEATDEIVVWFVGHRLCKMNSKDDHVSAWGVAYIKGNECIVDGRAALYGWESGFGNSNREINNFLLSTQTLQHEMSHLFGTIDHEQTNEPCTMTNSFRHVVQADDIWCDFCELLFDLDAHD